MGVELLILVDGRRGRGHVGEAENEAIAGV
jgi:hypothetical protein